MRHTIVTHVSPDFDAIGGVWLLKRYGGMEDAEVQFVNTGAPDQFLLASADAVVDTGRAFDPGHRRFDHHHLPGKEANETCAAWQVFMWLITESLTVEGATPYKTIEALEPLVRLIYEGDTGKPGANQSRQVGIHALLSAKKAQRADDYALLSYGFDILDSLAAHLMAAAEARRTLADHTVYRSDDGLVVALLNAPQGATFAAHEAGARLVVFASEQPDVPTYARGVMRGGEEADVHVGELTALVGAGQPLGSPIEVELRSWFRHEAGFFAGKGTAKAPCADPMECSIVDIAKAIDGAWTR